jgi:hypothetical protein
MIAAALFWYLSSQLFVDFLDWGWRYPFMKCLPSTWWLFARLRPGITHEYEKLLKDNPRRPARRRIDQGQSATALSERLLHW